MNKKNEPTKTTVRLKPTKTVKPRVKQTEQVPVHIAYPRKKKIVPGRFSPTEIASHEPQKNK